MDKICEEQALLRNDGGITRVPFLVKGRLVVPPEISRGGIEAAFRAAGSDAVYVKLPGAQVVREPVIDRQTMKYTGEYVYQVMPPVSGRELIEENIDKLAGGPYALSVKDILQYLEAILSALVGNSKLTLRVRELCRLTSEYPDALLDSWFASFSSAFNRETARQMIDRELSFWGRPGSEFLNGWVEVTAEASPGWLPMYARDILDHDMTTWKPVKTLIRAMPTRQLHITAGNTPEVPIISTLRAILTKSAAVIKLPYGATLPGALLALAAVAAAPEHPITQNLSVVYWQGGDESIENVLFMPNAFDRVVVWGGPDTVTSVRCKAPFTKIICLNPRYGISLIGHKAFSGNLEETVAKASMDVIIYNQKACIASLVHYVEGTEEQVNQYAEHLRQALVKWDQGIPNFVPPAARGQLKRMRRGRYAHARWYINNRDDEFASGVVVMPGEFDILDHPTCRLVVVRPVADLEEALKYLHQSVSTVGVYPEERRLVLRDRILARGVSSVLPLGQCEHVFAGMPHDGMIVLSQLVDWKNG